MAGLMPWERRFVGREMVSSPEGCLGRRGWGPTPPLELAVWLLHARPNKGVLPTQTPIATRLSSLSPRRWLVR